MSTTASLSASPLRGPSYELGPREFARLADMIYAESGIVLVASKTQLVHSRLVKRLRMRGDPDFATYLSFIERDDEERAAAVDALTTNHTKFFREQHHFDHVVEHVWPALRSRLDKGGRVRIWSAACSSGEEPYTLAMMLLGTERAGASRLRNQDFKILATDLSREVLTTAQAGCYPWASFDASPPRLRDTWVKRNGDRAEIDPGLRALVSFRSLNLLKDWPIKGQFDLIFCRNVMIYFDDPTKSELQARLADRLVAGGTMCIGHSERLTGPAANQLKPVGQTIYRKEKA